MSQEPIKILSVYGTRAELIKLNPVLEKLKNDEDFESIVVTTSQHPEAFDDLYDLFRFAPDHDLNLKRNPNCLADITNLALSGLEPLLKHHQPDLVLVELSRRIDNPHPVLAELRVPTSPILGRGEEIERITDA